MLPKANKQRKKKTICEIFHQKKIQKVLSKIEEMADIFLNSANFASHAFLTLGAIFILRKGKGVGGWYS